MRYLIYSRDSPKGSSFGASETTVADQARDCRAGVLCRDPAATFAEPVIDELFSGATDNRPGYRRILADLEAGAPDWDVLVVRHLDRLGRSVSDLCKIVKLLESAGKGLVVQAQGIDTTTPGGRMVLFVLSAVSQWEREMISERISMKTRAIAEGGGWTAGNVPPGYLRRGKRDNMLVVDPATAPAIRAMFEAFASGQGIAAAVKAVGRPRSRCYEMARNPVYIGMIPCGKETYRGKQEPLITRTLWDAVQSRLPAEKHAPRPNAQKARLYLLAGVIRCWKCGSVMSPYSSRGRGGKQYTYYQCGNTPTCHNRVKADTMEALAFQAVKEATYTPESVAKVVAALQKRKATAMQQTTPEIAELRRKADALARTRANLTRAMTDGVITKANAAEWNISFGECTQEQANVKARIELLTLRAGGKDCPYDAAIEYARALPGVSKEVCQLENDPEALRRFYQLQIKTATPLEDGGLEIVYTGGPAVRLSNGMVEHIGLEPMTSCMPCRRSSQLS